MSKAIDLWEAHGTKIRRMYHDDDLSLAAVAAEFSTSPITIRTALVYGGCEIKSGCGRSGKRNGRYKDGTQARPYRDLVVKKQCEKCGTKERLCVHHRNNNHFDNRPENLGVLCHSCHMSHHKTEYWKARRAGVEYEKGNGPVGWRR